MGEAEADPGAATGCCSCPTSGSAPRRSPTRSAAARSSACRRRPAGASLFRALLEGIAMDGANILKAMLPHLDPGVPERILAIGGITRNELLMRLKATLYGSPVEVLDLPDTTCLGAALLGGLAAGVFTNLDDARAQITVPVRTVAPEAGWNGTQRVQRQAIYAAAYAALRPLHARLLDG